MKSEASGAIRSLRLDMAAAVLNGIFLGLVLPFLAATALRLGGNAWDVTIIAAVPASANTLAVAWGKMTQRYSRIRLIFAFQGTARLAILGLAFATNATMIVLLVGVFFILQSVAMPAYVGLMRGIYPEQVRGRYMSYVRVLGGVATLLGTYAAGAWFDGHFRVAAFVGFVLGAIGIAVFAMIREPDRQKEEEPEEAVKGWRTTMSVVRHNRKFVLLLIGVFVYEFFYLLPTPAYPVYQVDVVHYTNRDIGILSMAATLAALLFNPLWGKIIDRYSTMPVLLISALAGALLPLSYWYPPNEIVLLAGSFAAGMAASGMDLAWINYLSRTAGKHLSSFSGIYLSLVGVRGVVAPLVGAALLKVTGMHALFAISGVMLLFSLLPFLRLRQLENSKRGQASAQTNEVGSIDG